MSDDDIVMMDGICMSKASAAGTKAWQTIRNKEKAIKKVKHRNGNRKAIFKLRARLQRVIDELAVISEELSKYDKK